MKMKVRIGDICTLKSGTSLKDDVLIAAIIRNDVPIIPTGTTMLKAGDRVIVASSKKHHLKRFSDVFKS